MIAVRINGEPASLADGSTLAAALAGRGVDGSFAVAVNEEFVPRSRYAACILRDGDDIEVVAPMQGG